jgi:colanic acid/amylovoran biosynthesis glycosyltransferase
MVIGRRMVDADRARPADFTARLRHAVTAVVNPTIATSARSALVREFYDDMAGGLLHAYVYGSARLRTALQFTLSHVPAGAQRILDVGCGIGESTAALKRARPDAEVVGIDVSERLIGIARALHAVDGVSFDLADVAALAAVGGPFDVVVLIDVYEHIPIPDRPAVHAALDRLLAREGRILLTTPSVSYQQRLRTSHPERLQPVDEDVTPQDLDRLAADVGGVLTHSAHVSVWNTEDYTQVAIVRGAARQQGARTSGPSARLTNDPPARERAQLVASRLGVRVTRESVLLPCRGGLRVCIVQPNCEVYSERLIRDHLERLSADVVMVCDGWFPRRQWNGERLLTPLRHAVLRASQALGRWAVGASRRIAAGGLARYLHREKVEVVLAEYGLTGGEIADACVQARVPFVVHFHGFDAHHSPTLQAHHDGYRRMFDTAAGIIAVSRKMETQLLALGTRRDRLHFNPPGVDTARFIGADPRSAPPTFVSVGRFVDKKAPHLTLLAFQKVRAACPDARLIMFGDGYLLESAGQLARALRLAGAVEFRRARGHVEVAAALRAARAFVLHSVETADGDSEGLPVALLEGAATGLPVVSTDHAGIPDAVIDGESGFLVAEGDVDAMAARMIELAQRPELAGALGARGRQHMLAHYTIERSIAGLAKILAEAARR